MQEFHFRLRFVGTPYAKEAIHPDWQAIAVPDLVLSHGALSTVTAAAGTTSLRDAIVDKALFHERSIATHTFTPAMELPFCKGDTLTPAEMEHEDTRDMGSQHFIRVRTLIKMLIDRWHLATNAPYPAFAFDIIPLGMPEGEAYRATVDNAGTITVARSNVPDADQIN